MITSKVLTREREKELLNFAVMQKKERYVSGYASVPYTNRIYSWGPESKGLKAGIRIKNRQSLQNGEQLNLEMIIKNVSDEPIQLESEEPRRSDTLSLSFGGGESQEIRPVPIDHWSPVRVHMLNPGKQTKISCGGIWIANNKIDDAPGKYPAIYPQKLAAGNYRASIEMRIPGLMHSLTGKETWRGRLTTGEIKFDVK